MLEIGKKIGFGWSSEVFEWGKDRVIKLFFDDYPKEQIELESMITKKIGNAGLPVPEVFETVEYAGKTGIIYERIFGESLMKVLPSKVPYTNAYAKKLAVLHAKIHNTKIDGLPSQKELFKSWINPCPYISASQKDKVLGLLKDLPDGKTLCHNDFHPPNIIVADSGFVVIDWVSACLGDPVAEVAYSEMVMRMGDLAVVQSGKLVVDIFRSLFSKLYRRNYLKIMPGDIETMKRWLPVLVAARFVYKFESEIPKLQRMLSNLLK